MTTIQNSTATTTQIRRGASTALSISFDCTSLDTSIQQQARLQLLIDQAIEQWWNGLTSFQRSAHSVRGLNLQISASYLQPKQE